MEQKFINFKNLARYNTQPREVCRHKHIFNFQGNLFQFVLDIFIAEESHLLHRILRACPVHPRSEIQNHPLHREFPTLPCSWISRFKVNFLDNQFTVPSWSFFTWFPPKTYLASTTWSPVTSLVKSRLGNTPARPFVFEGKLKSLSLWCYVNSTDVCSKLKFHLTAIIRPSEGSIANVFYLVKDCGISCNFG